jgi:hypothetical protein
LIGGSMHGQLLLQAAGEIAELAIGQVQRPVDQPPTDPVQRVTHVDGQVAQLGHHPGDHQEHDRGQQEQGGCQHRPGGRQGGPAPSAQPLHRRLEQAGQQQGGQQWEHHQAQRASSRTAR